MNDQTKPAASKWNARYAWSEVVMPAPCKVVELCKHWLPVEGAALDLACGRGANAMWLAARGLDVHAWDISSKAIESIVQHPAGAPVNATVRDVVAEPPAPCQFDVITVARFLDRGLCPHIAAALKPGGVLFYQTFTHGLSNPDYLLGPNELLELFSGLHVCWYSEPETGESGQSEAMLVAKRR